MIWNFELAFSVNNSIKMRNRVNMYFFCNCRNVKTPWNLQILLFIFTSLNIEHVIYYEQNSLNYDIIGQFEAPTLKSHWSAIKEVLAFHLYQ